MLNVVASGLRALIFSPVMAKTSSGIAAMPRSPIRIAWSFSSRSGSSCRKIASLGVDLGQRLRAVGPPSRPTTRAGPGQPLLVGHAAAERQRGLGHRQRDPVAIRDRLDTPRAARRGDGVGIGVERESVFGPAVVHPVLVAARALRHDGDEGRLAVLSAPICRGEPRRTGRSSRPRPARRRSSASSSWPAGRSAGRRPTGPRGPTVPGSTGPDGPIASGFW